MQDIHVLLDDVKNKSQNLVDEIETFKNARALNQSATESLIALNNALQETLGAIIFYTEPQVLKTIRLFGGALLLNILLVLIALILVIIK